ncbi:MAG: hypothetical protein KAU26_06055, partial [Methylococcales bacterium]|nr:hypothetical protein [Methylococcales bacterium]
MLDFQAIPTCIKSNVLENRKNLINSVYVKKWSKFMGYRLEGNWEAGFALDLHTRDLCTKIT